MSERLDVAEYQHRPLNELVALYLAQEDSAYLGDSSAQVEANAPPGFMEGVGRSQLMVPISVDAAREPLPGVLRTVDQLAQQVEQGAPPLFAMLHLNRVHGKGEAHARLLADGLRVASRELPFPLSFFETAYITDVAIGGIKRDTMDAAIVTLAAAYQGRELPERFAIYTQDADLIRLARKTLPRMAGVLATGVSCVFGPVRHARSRGRFAEQPDMPHFPQMDRVMWEFDTLYSLAASQYRWEVQTLSLLRDYFLGEGIDPADEIYEMDNVMRRAEAHQENYRVVSLKHEFAVMSARRGYYHMHRGISPANMWRQGFGTGSDYRAMDLHELEDLPPAEAEAMIAAMQDRSDRWGAIRHVSDILYDHTLTEIKSELLSIGAFNEPEALVISRALRRRHQLLLAKNFVLAQAVAQAEGRG